MFLAASVGVLFCNKIECVQRVVGHDDDDDSLHRSKLDCLKQKPRNGLVLCRFLANVKASYLTRERRDQESAHSADSSAFASKKVLPL